MKKLSTLLISILILTSCAIAQHGFTIEYAGGGTLHTIDLLSATKTPVGTTMNSFGAGDFGANDILYAINSGTNEFYQIDTINGTTTLVGPITPPANHMWTGMAYDDATGIMYGNSSYGVSAGENSLHIIDVSDGSYTLVGTQTTAKSIACIAIDDLGQMYGINSGANGDLYQIDKATGMVTYVGGIGVGVAGMGQGLDFCLANGTMYMTNYNSLTFANTLRTVNLSTGATTQVGGLLGMWTGVIAIPGSLALSADFSADVTDVCVGGVVNFTDLSTSATSWLWTFEGGTPSTSTDQNPTITYNTVGEYDVTLEVSDGTSTATLLEADMITVTDIPDQPDTPTGPIDVCGDEEHTYTTVAVAMADSYVWEVLPSDAGTITGNGISAVLETSSSWNGTYTVKVNATNSCGTSSWSSELTCTLNFTPGTFFLQGGGAYCEGDQGMELNLDGSETDVDYELFYDGVSTGIIVAGTGSPISFGYQTDEGLYTSYGNATVCTTLMFGEAYVTVQALPGTGTQPSGPVEVCSGSTTDYQTSTIPDATSIVWTLDPNDAGVITGTGENITIDWSATFSGTANLSVYGTNDCGDGTVSDALEITVSELPTPVVDGETMVCKDQENIYSTTDNSGSTYSWEVVGGNISSGDGTSEIIILWTTVGPGTVLVTETSSENCEGISDTLEVTIENCTGLDESIFEVVKLFPNPAKNQITIAFSLSTATTYGIVVYNQNGQEVYTVQTNTNGGQGSHQINTESLPTGLYFVSMTTSTNQVYQSRFAIVR